MGSSQSQTNNTNIKTDSDTDNVLGYFFGKTDNLTKEKNTMDYHKKAHMNVIRLNGKDMPYSTKNWDDILTEKIHSESADELTIEVVGKKDDNLEKKLNNMGIKINYVGENKQAGGNDDSSIFSTTSEPATSTDSSELSGPSESSKSNGSNGSSSSESSEKKKKLKVKVEDESDSPSGDLVVDDEVSEEGIIIDSDDINTSDIEKMQARLFRSETSDDANMDADDFTDNYTDVVREALNDVKRKNNIYDSEERQIVDMNSDSADYMKRPVNKNMKYY